VCYSSTQHEHFLLSAQLRRAGTAERIATGCRAAAAAAATATAVVIGFVGSGSRACVCPVTAATAGIASAVVIGFVGARAIVVVWR
jgi:hypothetical protein